MGMGLAPALVRAAAGLLGISSLLGRPVGAGALLL